jgi:HTH-type transcriptional regulator, glycine betaine synthesis regulator
LDSSISKKSQEQESVVAIELEMSEVFADLADLFGNPASIGAIYGLLFASPEPLSMEEIVEKIGISTGTASQGLRRLVELEAIVPQKSDGERVTRFEAKLELRPFVGMFLEQQLLPRLKRSSERIEAIEKNLSSLQPSTREVLNMRLGRASKWHHRAKTLIPLLRRFLG